MTTEIIDRLFLELSQFTKAMTKKELELQYEVKRLREGIGEVLSYTLPYLAEKRLKKLLEGK